MLEEKLQQYRQRLEVIEKEESADYRRYAKSKLHLAISEKAYWRLDAIRQCLMLLDNIFGQPTAEHADDQSHKNN